MGEVRVKSGVYASSRGLRYRFNGYVYGCCDSCLYNQYCIFGCEFNCTCTRLCSSFKFFDGVCNKLIRDFHDDIVVKVINEEPGDYLVDGWGYEYLISPRDIMMFNEVLRLMGLNISVRRDKGNLIIRVGRCEK